MATKLAGPESPRPPPRVGTSLDGWDVGMRARTQLTPEAESARQARRFVEQILAEWDGPEARQHALLLVDALVTNTIGHDEAVLYVAGEVDLATAPRLLQALQAALASDRRVIVDLAGMSFIDSQGIRALLQAFKVSETGVAERLVLRSLRPQARKLLELTGLDQVLKIEG